MIQLRVLMLFITKQDMPPSNKAGELVPNAQTPGHETIFITLQGLALSKRTSFEKSTLC